MNVFPSIFATELFLPSWWSTAYQAAFSAAGVGGMGDLHLLPFADLDELAFLALVLGQLQSQFCDNPETPFIELSAPRLLRNFGARNRRRGLEKVLWGMGGLRLVAKTSHGAQTYALFSEEAWHFNGPERVLRLTPGPLTRELVLGYTNGYSEFMRAVDRKRSLSDFSLSQSPLPVSSAAWQDLQGVEHLLFLRIQESVRNADRLVSLDGVYALPFEEMFRGIRFRVPRAVSVPTPMVQRLILVHKLARKLRDHGLLYVPSDRDLLVFPPSGDGGPLIAWKAVSANLLQQSSYPVCVSRTFALENHVHEGLRRAMQRSFLVGDDQALPLEIIKRPVASLGDEHFIVDGSTIVPFHSLFCEWVYRCNGPKFRELPSHFLQSSALASVRDFVATKDFDRCFAQFSAELRSNSDYLFFVCEIPFVSVSTLATRSSKEFKGMTEDARLPLPLISTPRTEQQESETIRSFKVPPLAEKKPIVAPVRDRDRVFKAASTALDRMRTQGTEIYDNLRQAYIGSLDDESRNLVLAVKQSMQPDLFEKHLRTRLLRFMIENPAIWRPDEMSAVH